MNYFTLICILFAVSCSSSKDKKYEQLEDKLDKLTKLMESQQKPALTEQNKKEEINDNYNEASSMKIVLPTVEKSVSQSNKKKVILGEKNGNHFEFLFNNGTYWVKVKPQIEDASELELRIHGEDHDNPETISLVKVETDTFQGSGDTRVGLTNLELHYRVKRKETIIINFDLNFKE